MSLLTTEHEAQGNPRVRAATPAMRLGVGIAIAVATLPFLAEAVFILRSDLTRLTATMSDDAFYYLEIARRAADGQGFTFDGMNATTGYHPLWQWILVPLARIVGDETAFVQASRLLALVLVAAALAIITSLVWRNVGRVPALAGLLLAAHGTPLIRDLSDAMEAALVALVLAILSWALLRTLRVRSGQAALALGLVTAVLCLARLDMAVAVPIVAVVLAWRTRSLGLVWRWAAGLGVVMVPYGVWHLAANGGLLTTSAAVKARWTDELVTGELGGWLGSGHIRELGEQFGTVVREVVDHTTTSPLGSLAGRVGAVAVLFLAVVGALHGVRRWRGRSRALGDFGVSTATVLFVLGVKLLVDLWTVPRWVPYWYSLPLRLAVLVALGCAAGAGICALWEERQRALTGVVVAASLLVLVPSGALEAVRADRPTVGQVWQMEIARAADWIVTAGPPGRYGAFDAGLLGYRLDGRDELVNLDGLVNDHAFVDFLATHPDRLSILQREGIDYLANDLRVSDREGELGCAITLYEGAGSVRADSAIVGPDRMYVLDVRPCRSAG